MVWSRARCPARRRRLLAPSRRHGFTHSSQFGMFSLVPTGPSANTLPATYDRAIRILRVLLRCAVASYCCCCCRRSCRSRLTPTTSELPFLPLKRRICCLREQSEDSSGYFAHRQALSKAFSFFGKVRGEQASVTRHRRIVEQVHD